MKFLLLASSVFYVLLAQDCTLETGKWSLDYEFESETQIPEVLNVVDEFVFDSNFTINITVCEDADYYYYADDEERKEYVYELEKDYLWKLRFKLYEEWSPHIANCRNCTINKTLQEFRDCMKDVRANMTTSIENNWETNITEHLDAIKKEKEYCLEEITTLPPTTEVPTTVFPTTLPPVTEVPTTLPPITEVPTTLLPEIPTTVLPPDGEL